MANPSKGFNRVTLQDGSVELMCEPCMAEACKYEWGMTMRWIAFTDAEPGLVCDVCRVRLTPAVKVSA